MYTLNKKQAICIASLFTSAIVVLMSSCANHDFDWDSARCESTEYNYAYNFEQIFGSIDPEQSWDFSNEKSHLASTRAIAEGNSVTTINGIDFGTITISSDDKVSMTKNSSLYTNIASSLPDGKPKSGTRCSLVAPGNDFWVYPITCQGANLHDLYIQVGNNDPVLIYSKNWGDYSYPYCNGIKLKGGSTSNCSHCGGDGHLDEDCEHCEGGKVECTTCRGSGTTTNKCNTCKGEGTTTKTETCNTCNGTGEIWSFLKWKYVTCSTCNGKKTITTTTTCTSCNGSGFRTCNKCNGVGKVNCTYCSGKGTVTGASCTYCNGTGKIFTTVSMGGAKISAELGTLINIYITTNGNSFGTETGNAIFVEDNNTKNISIDNENFQSGFKAEFVGIEDLSLLNPDCDKDYNDLTLCIFGEELPGLVDYVGNEITTKTAVVEKRYMVEDMGYSDGGSINENGERVNMSAAVERGYTDIDFNDIVIDLGKYVYKTYKKKRVGSKETTELQSTRYTEEYTIRALGGTWDFELSIGNTVIFKKSNAQSVSSLSEANAYPKTYYNPNYPLWKESSSPRIVASQIYNTNQTSQQRGDNHYVTEAPSANNVADESWLCAGVIANYDTSTEPTSWVWNSNTHNIVFRIVGDIQYGSLFNQMYDSSTENPENYDSSTDTRKNVYDLTWPTKGATPKIVAFSITKPWQKEKVHVTKEWFTSNTMTIE